MAQARNAEPNPPFLLPGDSDSELLLGLPVAVDRLKKVDYDYDPDAQDFVVYCKQQNNETKAFVFTTKSKPIRNLLSSADTISVFNIDDVKFTVGDGYGN